MNKVFLIGNLASDPEIRTLQNGNKVANMTVATSRSWKDKDGNRQEKAQFHRIVVWNEHLVEVIENYLKKGRKVAVTGELEYRRWTNKDGVDVTSAEVVLTAFSGEIELLSPAPNGEKTGANNNDEPARSSQTSNRAAGGEKGGRQPAPADLDDEIPF